MISSSMLIPEVRIEGRSNYIVIIIQQKGSPGTTFVHVQAAHKSPEAARTEHWAGPDELIEPMAPIATEKQPQEQTYEHWAGPDELMGR